MVNIIIIRGNSGSGKTTVARKLHEILGRGNLLISQRCSSTGNVKCT
ncbi:Uncharacterised protein [Staphylococcus gallinarum]|uniref:Phosphoribulokinase/uridine kinase domain-containing protein n=1 Tax=Staphylococcus gallinarum TaxID=1293 RepID=A0A380FF60_STAGA|nr:Uncharacterised protein [Staphylococcus gallinarum]